jgi:4-carboxymuconolactone decarboxylase
MARVALIRAEEHPELADLMAKLSAGRRGRLINVYRMLLNSPPLAESWFNHSNAVRWGTTLDGRLREIVIIRLGHLTGAQYVLRQHVPSVALADGLTVEECDALADWRASRLFSEHERAALAYADTMTRDIEVPDRVFADVKRHFRRAPDCRTHRPYRHLQHERTRSARARARPRAARARVTLVTAKANLLMVEDDCFVRTVRTAPERRAASANHAIDA